MYSATVLDLHARQLLVTRWDGHVRAELARHGRDATDMALPSADATFYAHRGSQRTIPRRSPARPHSGGAKHVRTIAKVSPSGKTPAPVPRGQGARIPYPGDFRSDQVGFDGELHRRGDPDPIPAVPNRPPRQAGDGTPGRSACARPEPSS